MLKQPARGDLTLPTHIYLEYDMDRLAYAGYLKRAATHPLLDGIVKVCESLCERDEVHRK